MTDVTEIEFALRQVLPEEYQHLVPQIATTVAAVRSGTLSQDLARERIGALPGVGSINQALIAFDASQVGDVAIGDVAGRDIIKLALTIIAPTVVASSERPSTQFYGDYTLPAIYIERRELLAQVREQLLRNPQGLALTSAVKVQRPAALHGMGGIGKTVIARAICDDPAIRAAFPDGIFWVTLGQQPDLVRPLRGIVEQLGGIVSDNAPTPQSLKAQLVGLLEDKACLLVADDIWHKRDAELLRVGGPKCRLFATVMSGSGHRFSSECYVESIIHHRPAPLELLQRPARRRHVLRRLRRAVDLPAVPEDGRRAGAAGARELHLG